MQRRQSSHVSLRATDQYLQEVKGMLPLTSDEEAQLLSYLVQGIDKHYAGNRLIEGYQPMIIALAKRFVRNCTHLELLDFVQEGNLGLLRAIEKYDDKHSSAFKTFAFTWVRGAMLMAYWQYERMISLPLNKVRAMQKMNVMRNRLLVLLGHEPTSEEVSREMGVKERDIDELIVLQERQVVSLHLSLDEESDTSLENVLEDPAASSTEEHFSSAEDVLDVLTERERIVLQLRYGLIDGHTKTQQEVAKLLGMALSTVQMLDRRAKMRLRNVLVA